jgi:predicted permease
MNWLSRLLRKSKMERQLQAELADHFNRQVADNLRAGMNESEARRDARLKFGGTDKITEDCRDARGTVWLESIVQDIRYALRTLFKTPGFAATAILTLALGIGANAAIFELLDAVRLRSLPVAEPSKLVQVEVRGGNHGFGINSGDETNLTYPLWLQIRDHQQSLSSLFAWKTIGFELGGGDRPRDSTGMWVSGGMFQTLGVNPVKGRLFRAEDDKPGCGIPGAVISYAFWQSEFGGQDSAIGSRLIINDHSVDVIGVTPQSFFGLEVGTRFDFALPMCSMAAFDPGNPMLSRKDYFWIQVIGRLKPNVTLARASSEFDALSPGIIEATTPSGYTSTALEVYKRYRFTAVPAGNGVSDLRRTYDASLWLLLGITGLVLLIACANLASLMLARASTRSREMALRLALGASRWRLVRQLLSEGLLVAATGAIAGVILAGVFSRSLVRLLTSNGEDVHLDLGLDWRVVIFVAAVAILNCIIFGLAPAFRSSSVDPGAALKAGGRGTTAGGERFSFQRVLVISQIAVSLVLLVGAFLFVRSFRNLMTTDPGFRTRNIIEADLNFEKANVPAARLDDYSRDLLAQIRSIPQVESAASATHLPFAGSWTSGVTVDAKSGPSKFAWASPGYFQTLGIPLIAGRDFTPADTRNSPHVAIVSESFVRDFLAGANPIGKIIRTAPEPNFPATTYEIVGLVRDTKYSGLRETVAPPEAFAPDSQYPSPGPSLSVLIYSSASPATLFPAVRAKMGERSSAISVDFDVLEEEIQNSLLGERMMALLSGCFGALAALLATIGLYGVISYLVEMRRNEIGIRMALGAGRRNIVTLILRQTLVMLVLGVAVGLILSFAASRSVASLIFGLAPTDPVTLAGAALFLIAVALLASYIPARRASRIEPMIALRHD